MGLESHTKRFSKIFCKEFLELEMFNEYQDFLSKLMPEVMNQQWGNCHFDFEIRNFSPSFLSLVNIFFLYFNK